MANMVWYSSTDGSAPVLTGAVGDLINLLAKCLVDGYGAKAAAGWTKPYTSTNAAVFRQGAGGQRYYQIDDNGPGAGGAREARAVGYETMSAYATGTNLFPTAAQMANGVFIRKSATADSTARAWYLFADDRTAYGFIFTGDNSNCSVHFMLGDIESRVSADSYAAAIFCRDAENSSSMATSKQPLINRTSNIASGVGSGAWLCRPYTGVVGSVQPGLTGSDMLGAGLLVPNLSDYGYYADTRILVYEPVSATIRGVLRGIHDWKHSNASYLPSVGYQFAGVGKFTGKNLVLVPHPAVSYNFLAVEVGGAWA